MTFELSDENKLMICANAGQLVHVFGEGYSIVDENGNEINTFTEEEEFNRLI